MDKTEFVLGLDVGSSSAKVAALRLDGTLVGLETESYPVQVPRPAWAEQDGNLWLPAIGKACGRLLARTGLKGGNARGAAISSAAHIGVFLDEKFRLLRPCILWFDQRSAAEAAELGKHSGEEIFALCKNWPSPTWTLPQLQWVKRHDPENWARTRHLMLSKDYLAFLLTGRMASDPAAAVSAMLYDATSGGWSERLCTMAGLSGKTLPEILPIGGEIGKILPDAARLLGISAETRVFNGTMDSTAETFSAGVRREGECVIRLASAGGIHGISHPPRVHPKLISYPYPVAPYWLSQAGTNTCASSVSWACALFGGDGGEPDYAAWDALAAGAAVGSGGALFHPYLAGERCPCWDSALRASFTGCGMHTGRGDVARAVYEGTALSLRDALGVLQDRGFVLSRVSLVGGGAKSSVWCRIVSSVLGCEARAVPEADSSSGAALLALIGLGEFASPGDVPADLFGSEAEIAPDPEWREAYDHAFARYKSARDHLSAMYHAAP